MNRFDCREIANDDPSRSEVIRLAYECFVKIGYVILDNVVPETQVRALKAEFDQRYARYTEDREFEETLETGNRRFMVPVEFSGGFADRAIYAHPLVIALIREVLDPEAIVESYGALISLPGARAQHIHRDNPLLFDSGIAPLLPAHAVNFALPLIEMNDHHGTTALWPGSHRWKDHDVKAVPDAPVIPIGSCVMWDFRTFHSGTPNRAETHRPMVYATYARRWYRDPANFDKATQKRLSFGAGFLQTVPDDCRALFWHVDPSLVPPPAPAAEADGTAPCA